MTISTLEIAEMARRESDRLSHYVGSLLRKGYRKWHAWDVEQPRPGDSVVTLGMVLLWKKRPIRRLLKRLKHLC